MRRAIGSRGAHPVRLRFARGRVGSGRAVGLSFRRSRAGSDHGRSAGRHAAARCITARQTRRRIFNPVIEAGAERGLRHIGYSRPGFGASTRLAGRTVASCALDVAAIADALGYDRFYSVGASGGGPHVIACAALLPDRVIAAAAIASPAPFDAEGLDWTAGMGQENVDEFAAMEAGDDEFEAFLVEHAEELRGATGDQIIAVLGDLVSEVDRQALSGEFAAYLVDEAAHALSNGVWGWFDDDRAFGHDWGFDLTDIRAPLSLWHGAQDRFVPDRPRRVVGRPSSPPTPTCGPITGTSPWS